MRTLSYGLGLGLAVGAPGVPANALLDEDGNPILDEDGNYILDES